MTLFLFGCMKDTAAEPTGETYVLIALFLAPAPIMDCMEIVPLPPPGVVDTFNFLLVLSTTDGGRFYIILTRGFFYGAAV